MNEIELSHNDELINNKRKENITVSGYCSTDAFAKEPISDNGIESKNTISQRRMISPKYSSNYIDSEPSSILRKADVLLDCIDGWFLQWADKLVNEENAGFAVIHICFSYFEFIEQMIEGESSNNSSKIFFKKGIKFVFPNCPEQAIDMLYAKGRCGLFHSGMAKNGILLRDQEQAIVFENGNCYIDKKKFLNAIRSNFYEYIKKIKEEHNCEAIDNFNKGWKIIHYSS